MTREVFDNEMTAHVWAQGRQARGRSANGNFFFEGPFLYSYGRHFPVAFRAEIGGETVIFLNSDKYSISTNRHQSLAWRAARHFPAHHVPHMREAADAMEFFTPAQLRRTDSYGVERRADATRALESFVARNRLELTDAAAAALFRLIGRTEKQADHRAAVTLRTAKAAKAKAAKDAARAAHDAAKAAAVFWGDMPPAALETLFRRDPVYGPGPYSVLWHDVRNRTMLGAMRKARELGWTRRAAMIKAHRAAVAAFVAGPQDLAIGDYRSRREIRAAILEVKNLRAEFRRTGRITSTPQRIESAAARLSPVVAGPFGAARLRLFGFDPAAVLAAVPGHVQAAARAARLSRRAQTIDLQRANIAAIRGLFKPDATRAEIAAGWRVLHRMAGGVSGYVDPAWRLAGWTYSRLEELELAGRRVYDSRMESIEADELAAWREGQPGAGRPRRRADGKARVRAIGVERDSAGNITGGTLETDQGAFVPLIHAIRVFRMVALCRQRGEGWAANGRTLPVGHFRVDLITADGGFRAGCHEFDWPEIAALAQSLGLEMAGADTTESRT